MSTKNLARTVIEGGRTGYSKWDRKRRAQKHRVRQHGIRKRLLTDLEYATALFDDDGFFDWDAISHADRVNPCKRFLVSRVGRPWNDVYSEIRRKFDRRTLPGRHVVEDHLLREVELHERDSLGNLINPAYEHFYVDAGGILRHNPRRRRW